LNVLANKNREQVNQELQKLLGKDVGFDALEVSLWGGLGFSAREFRVADNPRFAATPLIHAKELKLGVSLLPLLFGRVVIDSLTFENPELQIITNEEGVLNLSALAFPRKELGVIPKLPLAAPLEKKPPPVSFLVTRIRFNNGRVDCFDRSVREPGELEIRNVNLEVKGLDVAGTTRIKLAAALTEGLNRDMKIEGRMGPLRQKHNWSEQPVDLEMQFDSLYLPMLNRAMPFLRNQIPRELDVTGPMSFHARLSGTFEQPRLTEVTLKVPFFASTDYNAILTGSAEFPRGRSWGKARLQGKLNLNSVNPAQLRNLSFLKEALADDLKMEGPISIYSQFEGTWDDLRIGAVVKAEKSDIRYRDWLRKRPGSLADLRMQLTRHNNNFVLHKSILSLGNAKMTLSGTLEETPEPRLRVRLHHGKSALAAWGHLASPLSFYGAGGSAEWDITIDKKLDSGDDDWEAWGNLKLANAKLRHKESGRTIDQLNATVSFLGKTARLETASFRLGSSRIAMVADIADLARARVSYRLSSPELNPVDLPILPPAVSARLKNASVTGEMGLQNDALLLQASVSSSEGTLQDITYHNLRADLAWSPAGVSFKNVSMQILDGTLRSAGSWVKTGERSHHLEATLQNDSVDVRSVLARKFPELSDRIAGQLNLRGRVSAAIHDGQWVDAELEASGETGIQHGTIRDFNLISQLLLRGNESPASSKLSSRLPASLIAVLNQPDTRFDTLKGNFTVEHERIITNNLLLSTPEYTISGAGWIEFNGTTRWNGLLILSSKITQELQREYKPIRYLLDRKGRLSLSFRVEGILPNVRVRPDNRALAQALGWRASQKANEPSPDGQRAEDEREKRGWLPQSLDQWLPR
jgi:hypothetical protein